MKRLITALPLVLPLIGSPRLLALPEIWQRFYNNNELFPAGEPDFEPGADPDGDGWSNEKEAIAGTDPFSSQTGTGYLVPTCERRPGGYFRLRWPSQTGKDYQILASQDLVEWTPVGDRQTGGDYPLVMEINPGLLEGGSPPAMFWRVAVSDQQKPGGPYTPWELNLLSSRPDLRQAVMAAGNPSGGNGTAADPDSDGTGPTDRYDAAPNDGSINWQKLPEVRYLWIMAEGNGTAVDMNDKGRILYQLPHDRAGFDFTSEPVGEVWDPTAVPAQRRKPVLFNPTGLKLRMWKAAHAPGEGGGGYLVPLPDDVPVLDEVIWPPPSNDASRYAGASVSLRALGDDDSVAGDVGYSMLEKFGTHPESAPARFVSGRFAFLWKQGAYLKGDLVGEKRGFQDTISVSSRDRAIGFYEHPESGGTAATRLMTASHPTDGSGTTATLTFEGYELDAITGAAASVFPGQSTRPQDLGPPEVVKLSRTGKVLFQKLESGSFRWMVTGTTTPVELPAGLWFESVSDVPAGGAASWGAGSDSGFMIPDAGPRETLPSAAGVLQFDRTGTGIGAGIVPAAAGQPGIPPRFIWRNSRWIPLETATNLPAATFTGLAPRKITPSGLIWMSDADGTRNGVLVPLRVAENTAAPAYTGTDTDSLEAEPSSQGYQDRFWIMAPGGNDSSPQHHPNQNECHLHLPLAGSATLGTTVSGADVDHPVMTLGASMAANPLRWHGTAAASTDTVPAFSLSGMAAAGGPMGVKVMKHRKATVHVHRITQVKANGLKVKTTDWIMPTKQALETYLNELYGPQINLYFDVTLTDDPVEVAWDANGDGYFNEQEDAGTAKEKLSSDQSEVIDTVDDGETANINVYLMGSGVPLGQGYSSVGFTHRPTRSCFVLGSDIAVGSTIPQIRKYTTPAQVMFTIGHEIGHVLVGYGHPDSGLALNQGPAPLEGTDRSKRLLCSGPNGSLESRLLVKTEWDMAEEWLKVEEVIRAMNP